MLTRIGDYFIFLGTLFRNREKMGVYLRLIIDECMSIGVGSIFIVALVNTFIGAVTCVQTAYNLTNPFVPKNIIALIVRDSSILELAPTLSCIVLAGKVGSNIAGELGTMRISEQIDALEVMGINSSSYLILPKVVASVLMFPLLVIMAAFLSILGVHCRYAGRSHLTRRVCIGSAFRVQAIRRHVCSDQNRCLRLPGFDNFGLSGL